MQQRSGFDAFGGVMLQGSDSSDAQVGLFAGEVQMRAALLDESGHKSIEKYFHDDTFVKSKCC